jgi:uncharacterized protein (TIRG00374 family)
MTEREAGVYAGKPPAKFRKRLAVTIILGVGVFLGLALYADVGDVARTFADFNWSYVPLILLLTLLNYFLRFCKWDFFLRRIGVRLRARDSLAIFLSGLTMAVTPARLGEVFKSYLLKRTNGTEMSRSVPIVFAERVTDLLGMLTLAAISFSAVQYGEGFLIAVVVLLLALIVVLKSRRVSGILLAATRAVSLLNGLTASLKMAFKSAQTLMGLRNLAIATGISIVSAGVQCLAMYVVLKGFGADASLMLSIFVFSFSSLAGSVSMIPGGLVAAEGTMTGLLLLADVSKAVAVGATMVIRRGTLWLGIAIGVATIFLIRDRLLRKAFESRDLEG